MKYKKCRFPEDAWQGFVEKKKKMEETIQHITKKPQKLPMTDVLRFISQKQTIPIYDEELINYFIKSRKKKVKGGYLI